MLFVQLIQQLFGLQGTFLECQEDGGNGMLVDSHSSIRRHFVEESYGTISIARLGTGLEGQMIGRGQILDSQGLEFSQDPFRLLAGRSVMSPFDSRITLQ